LDERQGRRKSVKLRAGDDRTSIRAGDNQTSIRARDSQSSVGSGGKDRGEVGRAVEFGGKAGH